MFLKLLDAGFLSLRNSFSCHEVKLCLIIKVMMITMMIMTAIYFDPPSQEVENSWYFIKIISFRPHKSHTK